MGGVIPAAGFGALSSAGGLVGSVPGFGAIGAMGTGGSTLLLDPLLQQQQQQQMTMQNRKEHIGRLGHSVLLQ